MKRRVLDINTLAQLLNQSNHQYITPLQMRIYFSLYGKDIEIEEEVSNEVLPGEGNGGAQ